MDGLKGEEQGRIGQMIPEKASIHRSILQEWWTASGREKVSAKIVHPPCEGEQEAGSECQTQHPAHTARWKTVAEPLWNFPGADA